MQILMSALFSVTGQSVANSANVLFQLHETKHELCWSKINLPDKYYCMLLIRCFTEIYFVALQMKHVDTHDLYMRSFDVCAEF
jgi:hypothetical protein